MNYKSTRNKTHLYQCIKSIWPNPGEKDEHGHFIICPLSPSTLLKLNLALTKLHCLFPELTTYETKELVLQLLNWIYDTQPRGITHEEV